MQKRKTAATCAILLFSLSLGIALNTAWCQKGISSIYGYIRDRLGFWTESIIIEPGDVTLDADSLPVTLTLTATTIDGRGSESSDIRWRFLSEDGKEAPKGIHPLASPDYGTMIAVITAPGIYKAEASDRDMAETAEIRDIQHD